MKQNRTSGAKIQIFKFQDVKFKHPQILGVQFAI